MQAVLPVASAYWSSFLLATTVADGAGVVGLTATACLRASTMSVAYVACMHLLGRLGLMPRLLGRVYWASLAVPSIFAMRIGSEIATLVGYLTGMSEDRRTGLAGWAFTTAQALWLRACGHIRMRIDADSQKQWNAVSTTEASILLINHNSFFDALSVSYFMPHGYRASARVMFMDKMLHWPIFGPALPRCGYFPVYFTKYVEGNFKVSEKQAKVTEEMRAYLERGGRVTLFPEAVLSKNPKELLPFRVGSFKLIKEMKLRVYILTIDGTTRTWPRDAPLGGLPAQVNMSFSELPLDFDGAHRDETPEELATRAREVMQKQLDVLLAKNSK